MNRSGKKLNIVDLVVFAVIVIAIGYAVYAVAVNMQRSGGEAAVEYVVEVSKIRNELSEKIAEGQKVYDKNGDLMGEVTAVSVSQAYYEGANAEGNTVYSRIDGYNTIYVTVVCTAEVTPSGYEINGNNLAAGLEYSLRTSALYFEGQCVNVRRAEG